MNQENAKWLVENGYSEREKKGKLIIFCTTRYNLNCIVHKDNFEWVVEPGQGYCFTNSKSVFIQRYDKKSHKMKYSMLDIEGYFLFKNKFTTWYPDDYNCNFLVEHNKKFSLINKKGEFIIKSKFSNAKPFYNDRAIVKVGRLYGMIDYEGDWVLEPIYTRIVNTASRLDSPDYNVKVVVKTKDSDEEEIVTKIKMEEF